MSAYLVELLPEAEQEFTDAFLWYRARSPIAADAFQSLVTEAIDELANHADQWPADDTGIRYRVLSRFPYTLWYDLTDTTATVLAIAHQHRRPNFWRLRQD